MSWFIIIKKNYLYNKKYEMKNQYENAKKQVLWVYDLLKKQNVTYRFIQEFLYPDRIIEVNIPVQMDDGDIKIFTWYRSQHKNIRWPYKGWIRFHQDVSLEEVKALSLWMSIKTSVVKLPLWWSKWWIIVNPKELSYTELEKLSRWYVRQLYKYLWPDFDIPAPDVNTNSQIMAWMVDEYSKLVGKFIPWTFTWKPIELWGSEWRHIATSLGWLYVLEKYFSMKWSDINWKEIVIQWAWNAWLNFAKLVKERWWKIIAISDSWWAIYDKKGINIDEIIKIKNEKKSVVNIKNFEKITNEELLELNCDILVLAALENQITMENIDNINTSVILELANGPIIPDVDNILYNKNIIVIPDVLANAGWVTVSYFEQVQWNTNFYWDEKDIFEKLKMIMYESTKEVINLWDELSINYRKSAYILSLLRQYNAWKYIN